MAVKVAIITAVATLVASFGSIWLAQRGERDRRRHEERLRQLDHAHDDRQSLRQGRIDAYRRLTAMLRERVRAQHSLSLGFVGRSVFTDQLEGMMSAADRRTALTENEERIRSSLQALEHADARVEEAVDDVGLIASTAVTDAARRLSDLVRGLWDRRRNIANAVGDEDALANAWAELRAAEAEVGTAGSALLEAIRKELRLDG